MFLSSWSLLSSSPRRRYPGQDCYRWLVVVNWKLSADRKRIRQRTEVISVKRSPLFFAANDCFIQRMDRSANQLGWQFVASAPALLLTRRVSRKEGSIFPNAFHLPGEKEKHC